MLQLCMIMCISLSSIPVCCSAKLLRKMCSPAQNKNCTDIYEHVLLFLIHFFTTNKHKVRQTWSTVGQRTAYIHLAVHLLPFSLHYVHVSVNFLLLVWNYCFIWLPFLGQTCCLKRISALQSSVFTFASFCNTCQQGLSLNWSDVTGHMSCVEV